MIEPAIAVRDLTYRLSYRLNPILIFKIFKNFHFVIQYSIIYFYNNCIFYIYKIVEVSELYKKVNFI